MRSLHSAGIHPLRPLLGSSLRSAMHVFVRQLFSIRYGRTYAIQHERSTAPFPTPLLHLVSSATVPIAMRIPQGTNTLPGHATAIDGIDAISCRRRRQQSQKSLGTPSSLTAPYDTGALTRNLRERGCSPSRLQDVAARNLPAVGCDRA